MLLRLVSLIFVPLASMSDSKQHLNVADDSNSFQLLQRLNTCCGSLCLRRTSYLTTSVYCPPTPCFCLCVSLEVSVLRDCEASVFFGRQPAVGGALASAAAHKRACSAALKNVRNFSPTTYTPPNLCFCSARSCSRQSRLHASPTARLRSTLPLANV